MKATRSMLENPIDIVSKLIRWSPGDRLSLVAGALRGILTFRRFDEHAWTIIGPDVRIRRRNGYITAGRFVRFEEGCRIAVVSRRPYRATFSVGAFTTFGQRTIINVTDCVEIGERCSISWDCNIVDTDFHRIRITADEPDRVISAPIHIGDNVWIGIGCIILKGVTIGDNCVIGAGSVVTKDIPSNSFAAGNPAAVIREIAGWSR
jgi:acetyltransferase-like isoleucine patch superfamily enzyme